MDARSRRRFERRVALATDELYRDAFNLFALWLRYGGPGPAIHAGSARYSTPQRRAALRALQDLGVLGAEVPHPMGGSSLSSWPIAGVLPEHEDLLWRAVEGDDLHAVLRGLRVPREA